MKVIGIRQLSGSTLAAAARSADPLALSNGGVLCAVLFPVTPRWVESLVEQNLSRLVSNIELAEKDRANEEPLMAVEDPGHPQPEPESESAAPEWHPPRVLRRVSIRKLSGEVISQAAEQGETLGVTNNGMLCAVLFPVTPRWVESLVEQNFSRLFHNIRLAEKDRARGEPLLDVEDSLGELSWPAHADPAFAGPGEDR